MSSPAPEPTCPRCRATFAALPRYCSRCGAELGAAATASAGSRSRLSLAETSAGHAPAGLATADRRLSDSNQAWLGRVVDGRYRVLDVIGRGGMGVVYRVEHLRMGKIAAMKVLHRDLAGQTEIVRRFEREAAAVSRLQHPHVVQVFDFGTAQGALYLIMELVRGQDLAAIVERDGALAWARAAPLFAQICDALEEAHGLGVIHRDLKPENVLVTRTSHGRDYAKVLDFGLALLDSRGQHDLALTDRSQIVGTPYFMSPEQIRGDQVDERSDIYSLGALMFNVLTGQQLFDGTSAVGVLTRHLTEDPEAPSNRAPGAGIPPEVDQLVLRCLAKDPAERWPDVGALAAAIEEVFAETVTETTGAAGSRVATRRAAAPRLQLPPEESDDDADGDVRLRRADIDSYERGLRRRRAGGLAAGVALTLGLAGGAAWLLTREPPLRTEEHEPNDDLGQVNRIAPGTTVRGYLGRRRSPTDGDRDLYDVRFPDGRGRRHVVTVAVTSVPNLAVALTLRSGTGDALAESDRGAPGQGQVLHRRAVEGALLVEVSEPPTGGLPVENVSDPYALTVTVEPDDPGAETEPNNGAADATPLAPDRPVRGWIDGAKDVDVLRFDGEEGRYAVEVRAEDGPLAWRVDDERPRPAGAADLTLRRGALLRLERGEREAAGPGARAGGGAWSVRVTRR